MASAQTSGTPFPFGIRVLPRIRDDVTLVRFSIYLPTGFITLSLFLSLLISLRKRYTRVLFIVTDTVYYRGRVSRCITIGSIVLFFLVSSALHAVKLITTQSACFISSCFVLLATFFYFETSRSRKTRRYRNDLMLHI